MASSGNSSGFKPLIFSIFIRKEAEDNNFKTCPHNEYLTGVDLKQYHESHKKKVSSGTGGRKGKSRDKKLSHIGGVFTATKVADKDYRVKRRKRGGKTALKLKKAVTINVVTKEGTKKAKIIKVLESPNSEYVRTNTLTKGAVVETDIGKARITNRNGQDGIVNGVLI